MCDCCETGSHKGPYSSDPGAGVHLQTAERSEDLCHANFGVGDTYPNRKYSPDTAPEDYRRLRAAAGDDEGLRRRAIQDTAPALYFTCASQSDGITIFPCTGSSHRDGIHTICSCGCHRPSVSDNNVSRQHT